MSRPTRERWTTRCAEAAVGLGLFAFYLTSFELSSAVNGPLEIFAQDSVYILENLAEGEPYPWNPQNHILYHFLVERGYDVWRGFCGPGLESAYRYLKLFTALTGLGFLVALRWLLCEIGLRAARRIVLLLFAGLSVSAWFHFSAFETHGLALPAVALYLLALVRLRQRTTRSLGDRLLLVGSLAFCGWVRVDLFRLAAASVVLPFLPGLRRHRKSLAVDLALVAVLGAAVSMGLAYAYLEAPLAEAATAVVERYDRRGLREQVAQVANLDPRHLTDVGRAITLYSVLMPIEARPPSRSFYAPPSYELDLEWSGRGVRPATGLFLEPARNMAGVALSLLALGGVVATLAAAAISSLKRAAAGDPFHAALAAQALSGWLLYTWFNPFEPFLWILEFLPLWVALIADRSQGRGRAHGIALGLVVLGVASHNVFAFYLPFR